MRFINKNILKEIQISIIIPSIDGIRKSGLKKLIEDIKKQTLKPKEIIIVKGVKPRTKAHNIGVKKAIGEIVIFFDDDIRLGNKSVIKNLTEVILNNKEIGITGASILLPLKTNFFQKICGSQLHRAIFNITKETIESDMATHAAMAIRRDLYWEIGGEDESLRMNDDLLLRHRIRMAKYKAVIVKNTWVYHPQPGNLIKLLKKYFIQGIDQSYDYKSRPDLIYESPLKQGAFPRKSNLTNQIVRNIKIIIRSIIKIKLILLISRLVTGIGFIYGYTNQKRYQDKNNNSQGHVEIIKIK